MNEKSKKTLQQISYLIQTEGYEDPARFLRPNQAAARYGISKAYFCKVAERANALFRIGRMILVEKDPFEKQLREERLRFYVVKGDCCERTHD